MWKRMVFNHDFTQSETRFLEEAWFRKYYNLSNQNRSYHEKDEGSRIQVVV